MGKLKLATIAAMTLSNGVGKDGGLPWKLKGEMAYFRNVTNYVPEEEKSQGARNAVIMGRKTWVSIPPKFRPLLAVSTSLLAERRPHRILECKLPPPYLFQLIVHAAAMTDLFRLH